MNWCPFGVPSESRRNQDKRLAAFGKPSSIILIVGKFLKSISAMFGRKREKHAAFAAGRRRQRTRKLKSAYHAVCFSLGVLAAVAATAGGAAETRFVVEKSFLNFPVKSGAPKRPVRLIADGKIERRFEIELADGEPDWWAC